jgi:hypothetical protein
VPKRALLADREGRDRTFQLSSADYALRAIVMRLGCSDLLGTEGVTPEVIATWGVIVRCWPPIDPDGDAAPL